MLHSALDSRKIQGSLDGKIGYSIVYDCHRIAFTLGMGVARSIVMRSGLGLRGLLVVESVVQPLLTSCLILSASPLFRDYGAVIMRQHIPSRFMVSWE
jgi:hypothetical protein